MKKKSNKKKTPEKQYNLATKKETYPHFRKYNKSNHPALIVGEATSEEYKYRKVTSSARDGRHLNEKVEPNPDRTRNTPMYIGTRVRHDNKKHFSKWKYPWIYKKKK